MEKVKRDALGRFCKGHIVLEEWKKQQSKRMSGKKHPLYGKHRSIKTKQKMRLAKLGEKNYLFGKHRSEEIKKKIRLNHDDRRGEKNTMFGKTGENSANWKGGITPINKLIRQSDKAKEWRKLVFERDNYTCQNCDKRGGDLETHHIKPFSKYPELRFDVSNGLTLCLDCHRLTFRRNNSIIGSIF